MTKELATVLGILCAFLWLLVRLGLLRVREKRTRKYMGLTRGNQRAVVVSPPEAADEHVGLEGIPIQWHYVDCPTTWGKEPCTCNRGSPMTRN